jgi:hypothetical protein
MVSVMSPMSVRISSVTVFTGRAIFFSTGSGNWRMGRTAMRLS